MKLHPKSIFIVLFTFCTATSFSQINNTKPALFDAYPQSINLDNTILLDASTKTTGSQVSYSFANNFQFSGTVISNQRKYDNLQIIVIRSSENNHTFLQISKITNTDLSIAYTGRILNEDAADGYAIENDNGLYSLQKFETNKILSPCKL
jgi:hypothetical protein